MKITAVRTHVLQAALSQPFAYSRAWYDTRPARSIPLILLVGWLERRYGRK